MPREVTAYLCAFRCGGRAIVRLKSAEAHEANCARNPARRACKTCAHNIVEPKEDADWATNYPGYEGGYFCAVDALPADLTMVYGCPQWEPARAATHLATAEATQG